MHTQRLPKTKNGPPHWRRPFEEPKIRAQLTRMRLQCAALLRPRSRDSGQVTRSASQVLARASSVNGERSSDSYLRRPICEDLPGTFTCSPWGRRAPPICLHLPVPPTTLRQRHLNKGREGIGEDRPFVPKWQAYGRRSRTQRLLARPSPRSYNCCRSSRFATSRHPSLLRCFPKFGRSSFLPS